MMNPQTDKLVRRTTMVATITASYFLLTANYGPEPNALDPGGCCGDILLTSPAGYSLLVVLRLIKKVIQSAENSVKEFFVGSKNQSRESEIEKLDSSSAKKHP